MSGNALPFVGNLYMYLIAFSNTCLFAIYKYTKFLYSNTNANMYLNPTLVQCNTCVCNWVFSAVCHNANEDHQIYLSHDQYVH